MLPEIFSTLFGKSNKSTMKKLLLLMICLAIISSLTAQDIDCQITVSAPQVAGTDRNVYTSLQQALYEFINNRKWTNRTFHMEERVPMTIMINISDRLGSEDFKATLNLVLSRPVLNTAYNTVLVNYIEKDFQFRYVEHQPLDFMEGTYSSNLTSTVAFYIYMFLGIEFDSFSPQGGTPYYEKAQSIVNAAQNAQEPGWKGYESDKNKYWLVENYTNPSNNALRDYLYKFHRLGLDQMYDKLDLGRNSISESINDLKSIYDSKPNLMALQLVLDAKRDEFVNVFSDQRVSPMEKVAVQNILKEIDPANSSKYNAITGGK
jgi:hypothetical protein